MKRLVYLSLCSLVACATDPGADGLPIEPQGAPVPPAGSSTISARVCVADDLRTPAGCSTRDASGIIVTTDSAAATTDAAGNFTIDAGEGDDALTITGAGVIPTTVPLTFASTGLRTIPAIASDVYDEMLAANGVTPAPGTGSILATVTRDGVPSAGVTASATPASPFGPFFDADTPVNWGLDGTGQRGVVWIPGLTAGMVDLTFEHIAGGLETQVGGVTVRNGGVTILDTAFTTTP